MSLASSNRGFVLTSVLFYYFHFAVDTCPLDYLAYVLNGDVLNGRLRIHS